MFAGRFFLIMMNSDEDFGEWLRRLRLARQWSQDVLAEKAGTSKPTISRLENNRRGTTREMVTAVAEALGVRTDEALARWVGVWPTRGQEEVEIVPGMRLRFTRHPGEESRPLLIGDSTLRVIFALIDAQTEGFSAEKQDSIRL